MSSPKEAIALIIVSEDGKKVAMEKGKAGKWQLPEETLRPDEKLIDAGIRVAWQNLGIAVNGFLELGTTINKGSVRWYEVGVTESILKPEGSLREKKWVEINQVKLLIPQKKIELWPQRVRDYFDNQLTSSARTTKRFQ